MVHEMTDQPSTPTPEQSTSKIDPMEHLRVQMRVLGARGKQLGKVETLDHHAGTGKISSIVVRHGMFSNKLTEVSAARVKWVNSDSVILDLTPTAFKKLPRLAVN